MFINLIQSESKCLLRTGNSATVRYGLSCAFLNHLATPENQVLHLSNPKKANQELLRAAEPRGCDRGPSSAAGSAATSAQALPKPPVL